MSERVREKYQRENDCYKPTLIEKLLNWLTVKLKYVLGEIQKWYVDFNANKQS